MNILQNLWRSIVCLLISILGMGLLFFCAIKASPHLFQETFWGRVGILAIGIELGGMLLYFAMMLIMYGIVAVAHNRLIPMVIGILPIIGMAIRYPWWLISICLMIPGSLGFWQWVIIITWIGTWVSILSISCVGIVTSREE